MQLCIQYNLKKHLLKYTFKFYSMYNAQIIMYIVQITTYIVYFRLKFTYIIGNYLYTADSFTDITLPIIYISYRVTGLYRLGKTCYLHSVQ